MIEVRVGPLHEVETEALLRPVSSELAAVTGVGRDVDLRVGEEIHERLRALGTIPVGSAIVTPGGDLDVPFIIHVAVQSPEEAVTEAGIARALLNGLRRASEWDMKSVALPPLGTGAGNLDPESSAAAMLPVLKSHLKVEAQPSSITIVVANGYEEEIFRAALARLDEAAESETAGEGGVDVEEDSGGGPLEDPT
ncbi:MAG: macro domain-containing protein [Longimicrobiales bacterium]|nr:macro domain-containing protein [Longimicrobiales bacterium]